MRRWTSVIALLVCACGSPEPLLPSIVSVTPREMSTSESILLTVEFDGALPLELDYGEDSAQLLSLTRVGIADRDLPVLRVEERGKRLIAEILPWLPVGVQDLRVTLQDGQQVVLEEGFEVLPALDLSGFEIDPIAPQARQTPFSITLRAVGPDAARFRGRVKLYSNNGTVEPEVSGPFEAGVLTQEIVVDKIGGNNVRILVEDYVGNTGASPEFRVDPP